jgi:hypothetical protein
VTVLLLPAERIRPTSFIITFPTAAMRPRIAFLWLLLLTSSLAPADPTWWEARGVKTTAPAANLAPATIGQAKHMAAMALAELEGHLPAPAFQALETDLATIVDLALPDPLPSGFRGSQRAVLLTGQLKAIAKPFYDHLRSHNATWLDNAMTAGNLIVMEPGSNPPTPSPYPWSEATTDDANRAPATLGQLKAVFSLPLETLTSPTITDTDGDGISDEWEILHGLDLNDPDDAELDSDEDGISNLMEFQLGLSPTSIDIVGPVNLGFDTVLPKGQEPGGPVMSFRDEHPSDLYAQDDVPGWKADIGDYIEVWDEGSGNPYVELQSHRGAHGITQEISMLPGTSLSFILRYKGRYEYYESANNAFTLKVEAAEAGMELMVNGESIPESQPGVRSKAFMETDAGNEWESWHHAFVTITAPEGESLQLIQLSLVPNQTYSGSEEITHGGFVDLLPGPFEFLEQEDGVEVSADDSQVHLVVQIGNGASEEGESDPFEDAVVEWEIVSGIGGSLSGSTSIVEDGLSAITLQTSTISGSSYVVKARLKSLAGQADFGDTLPWMESPIIEVIPGQPHMISASQSKNSYRSDGTNIIDFLAEVKDEHGNLVEDGTSVTWLVNHSPTPPFSFVEHETTDGIVNARLVAPRIPEDQIVDITSGLASAQCLIDVEGVTGSLSGDINLEVGYGSNASSTITATVQAADGTPVFWTTSNGEIVDDSVVSNGSATTTLTSANGRMGQVVVTATVGDKFLYMEGAFVSNGVLAMGADHPVIVSDETENGTELISHPCGVEREIPYYASTQVNISGPPNQVVEIDVKASIPVAEWHFAPSENQVLPSSRGNHPLTLVEVDIVEQPSITGGGSLFFEGDGHASVQANQELDFSDEFSVQMIVAPKEYDASSLIEKPGVWKIKMLEDGLIEAWVHTSESTYTATTSQALPLNEWTNIQVDFRFGLLTVYLNGVKAIHTDSPGSLPINAEALKIGSLFVGHINSLALQGGADPGTHISTAGIGPNGAIQLDANGKGQFTLGSLGTAPSGTQVMIRASYNPADVLIVAMFSRMEVATQIDVALSFIGADPQTGAGTAASMAGGLFLVGDVGAYVKNLYRIWGFSEKDVNSTEMLLAGIGVLTTAVSWTGAGTAADAALASVRAIAGRMGHSVEAARFIEMLAKIISDAALKGEFGVAEARFIQKLADDVPVADAFKLFLHDDFIARAAIKAADKLGDNAESFYQAATRVVSTHGAESAKMFVQVFENLGDEALTALKNVPAGELDDALDGLARLANKGIPPFSLSRVLNNSHLYGSQYTRTSLLKDLDELVIAEVKGIDDMVAALKSARPSSRGIRYELEGAAYLIRNAQPGERVMEVGRKFLPGLKGGTDFDVVFRTADGKEVFYQFKSSYSSFRSPHVKRTKAWVSKVGKHLGITAREAITRGHIQYAVPNLSEIPVKLRNASGNAISLKNLPQIPVKVIPMTP